MPWSVFMTFVIQGIIVFVLVALAVMTVLAIAKAIKDSDR